MNEPEAHNQAIRRMELLIQVEGILMRAPSLDEAVPEVLKALGRNEGWVVGGILLVNERQKKLRPTGFWAAPEIKVPQFETMTRKITFAPGVGSAGRAWKEQKAIWFTDVTADSNFLRVKVAALNGLKAGVAFPVWNRGRIIGVVEFFSTGVRPPDASLMTLMEGIGMQLGEFIERKRLEDALNESERRLKAIFRNARAAISLKDLEGRYIMINPFVEAALQTTCEAIRGKTLNDYIPQEDADLIASHDRQVIEAKEAMQFEESLHLPDGFHTFVSVRFPLLDGKEPYAIGVMAADITDLKRLEDELRHRNIHLEELDRLKSQFINTVIHELRTPLTSIVGFTEFLDEGIGGSLSPPQQDYVQQILMSASRLEFLLDDLLDFARMGAGTFRLQPQTMDFHDLVRAIVGSLKPQAKRHHLTLKTALQGEVLRLAFDPQRIGQVLTNLIGNAIKFTPGGGTITIRDCIAENRLRCEVIDTGGGIAESDLPKLFKPFSQLEASLHRGSGVGLGLSISKAIIEAHGGEIGAESKMGEGSVFWFSLPMG